MQYCYCCCCCHRRAQLAARMISTSGLSATQLYAFAQCNISDADTCVATMVNSAPAPPGGVPLATSPPPTPASVTPPTQSPSPPAGGVSTLLNGLGTSPPPSTTSAMAAMPAVRLLLLLLALPAMIVALGV